MLFRSRYFKQKFTYDKSGLVLIAGGENLSLFTVHQVLPNSPAEAAGFQKGDELVRINHITARFFSLGELNRRLQGRNGKTLRIIYMRRGQRLKASIKLRDMI